MVVLFSNKTIWNCFPKQFILGLTYLSSRTTRPLSRHRWEAGGSCHTAALQSKVSSPPILWIRIRVDFHWFWSAGSGSVSELGMQIRITWASMAPKKRQKSEELYYFEVLEVFYCRDCPVWRPRDKYIAIYDIKNLIFFNCTILQFFVIKFLDPDPL